MVQNYAHAMYAFFGAGEFAAEFVRPSFFGKTQPSQHRHCQSNFCYPPTLPMYDYFSSYYSYIGRT